MQPQNPYQPGPPPQQPQPNLPPQSPPHPAPSPTPQPGGQAPYDFFMGGQPAANGKSRTPGAKPNILYVIIGGAVLLIIVILAVVLLSSGGGAAKQQVLSVVQKQQEIIRIADMGIKSSRGSRAANLAITTKLAVTTSQQQLTTAVKGKFSDEELAQAKNTSIDQRLKEAEQASRFDEAFIEVMEEKLQDYKSALQSAFNLSESNTTRNVLNGSYVQARILLHEPVAQEPELTPPNP